MKQNTAEYHKFFKLYRLVQEPAQWMKVENFNLSNLDTQ